jgi:ribosomal small subunit protein bTHX
VSAASLDYDDDVSDEMSDWRFEMGKGDLRSRKGKIYRGTNGKTRPQNGKKRDHAAEARSQG